MNASVYLSSLDTPVIIVRLCCNVAFCIFVILVVFVVVVVVAVVAVVCK